MRSRPVLLLEKDEFSEKSTSDFSFAFLTFRITEGL
jgi:hypothetical protein